MDQPLPVPPPADGDQCARGRDRWREMLDGLADRDLAGDARRLSGEEAGAALLDACFGNSPFLTRCLLAEPETVVRFLRDGPDTSFIWVAEALDAHVGDAGADTATVDRALRVARRRTALVVALADLSGAWPLERVTRALSDFAAQAIGHAFGAHLRAGAARGVFAASGDGTDLARSGLFVLGMGKLGAYELNYSSDIDLIVLYDPDAIPTARPDRMRQDVVRLTQSAVDTLERRTGDGYVFRTDLRLRPDPGSTPLAISVGAAEAYYESMGQNWERAAMIKARVVAGDEAVGTGFLGHIRPFVWRRNLDFAAIQDIHSIKRQIHAHKGGGAITVLGHDIKVGRGGIREVEFFAQTQQLIFGGREPALRSAGTCRALELLAEAERIGPDARDDMIAAYRFLRTLEHRLQMVDDQQTQKLPATGEGLAAIAAFMGFPDRASFEETLLGHLHRVEDHYAALFEEAPSLSGPGNLVFTGGDHDPDTLATLAQMGFGDAEGVSARIRAWHHGRYRATRSTRAREILTELIPALLQAFSETASPDDAFKRFDTFLQGLPAGVQLFSLFLSNPELLALVAEIMGTAPGLARRLSQKPALFDAVLTGDFFEPLPGAPALREELDATLDLATHYEELLDSARRWYNDRAFQIGVQLLRARIDAVDAGRALADAAGAVIGGLLPRVEAEFASRHGRLPGGGFCVVAFGKLGGRALTAGSDADLVFVYDAPDDAESDGERPLPASLYYARFAQRLVNALTAPTAEGTLFEVDLRLRPAGSQGPLAAGLATFVDYQRDKAWVWEHMALTRARLVAGDPELGARIETAIAGILRRPRDPAALAAEVDDMRRRMAEVHGTNSVWEIKHVRGGLVDVEFIAQYLALRHAAEHPEVVDGNTVTVFERLGAAGLLDAEVAADLAEAARLYLRVQAILRLTVDDRFDPASATEGLTTALARAAGRDNLHDLETALSRAIETVRGHYERIVAAPARDAKPVSEKEPET